MFGSKRRAKPKASEDRYYKDLVGDPAWPPAHRQFYEDLIDHSQNFSQLKWLGRPIWQPVPDIWVIQETLSEIRPALLVECGTHEGGSALFYAHLFDLLDHGRVITIDVEKLHDLAHPRIEFLLGSSVDDSVFSRVREAATTAGGPVMVILDSDHSAEHVAGELETYHELVTPGSYLLVEDGIMDHGGFSGPLAAIREFLPRHPEFTVDEQRCRRFLVTHHPMGWLRRS
jgi:cephalosporin hydroxylase